MRTALVVLFLLMLTATPVLAQNYGPTPTRCGFSLGFMLGGGVPTASEMTDDIDYEFFFDIETKYYLWKPFSLAGGFGVIYGEGHPEDSYWHENWITLDDNGRSFQRSLYLNALLRVEIGRYWAFNPYVGGGAGVLFNTLERLGYYQGEPVSDYYQEFVPQYIGLVGWDYAFDKYVTVRMEGRYTMAPSTDPFVDEQDLGSWFGLIGMMFYL